MDNPFHITSIKHDQFFTITSIKHDPEQQKQQENSLLTKSLEYHKEEINHVVNSNNDVITKTRAETFDFGESDNGDFSDSGTSYSPEAHESDDEDDEGCEDNNDSDVASTSGTQKQKTADEYKKVIKCDELMSKCPFCNIGHRSKTETLQHVREVHLRNLPIKCRICGICFKTNAGLSAHQKVHNNSEVQGKTLSKKCPICGKCYQTDAGLSAHTRTHSEGQLLLCPICNIHIKKVYYINHMLKHESINCFPCQVCGQIFKTKEEHMTHCKSLIKEKPYGCEICYRRFKRADDLKHHLESYKLYSCAFCSVKFNSAAIQKPPYACSKCQKIPDINKVENQCSLTNSTNVLVSVKNEFDEQINDKTHYKVVENEASTSKGISELSSNRCKQCEGVFATKRGLVLHVRKCHKENVPSTGFKCSTCGKIFYTLRGLSAHSKNHDISTPTNFPSFDNTQNKEFFTITSIGQAQQLPIVNPPLTTTLQTHDQEIVQVVYLNNDTINGLKPETINIEETDDENYLTISDTDDDFDEEDDENVSYLASTSANVKQTTKDEPQLYRCPYCHLSQKDKYETFKHIEKFHPSKNRKMLTKKCKTCGKCFRSDYSLKVHKKLHTEKILKKCKICSIKIMKSNYINHILKHESHDCFPCQVCGKILKTNEERIAHSKNHIEENPFVCDICLRRFKRKSDLESHLMSHKQYSCSFCPAKFNTINRQKSPYACPLCRKVPDIMKEVERQHNLANIYHVFDSDRNLTAPSNDKQFTPCTEFAEAQQQNNAFEYFIVNEVDDHMINEDSELNEGEQGPAQINSNKCHVCYRGFKTKKKMLKHVQRVHGPEREHQRLLLSDMRVDEDVEDEFISVTDNPNDTENSLETYIISDSDEADTTSKTRCTSELAKQKNPTKLYKCKYCDKVAKSKSGLGKHVGILHSDKCDIYKYNCTMCNRGFHTHSGLILHIRTSHEGLQFKCPLCPVKRFRESVFLTHLMTHESDTCFPCPVCGQLFASGNERALHWDGHATERPFVCKYCSKRFSKEYMLKHHLKRHNQYGCNFCSKSFVSEKTLNPPYACRKCEMDPDIKRQVELQKLMKNRQVFESDEDEGDERQEILI